MTVSAGVPAKEAARPAPGAASMNGKPRRHAARAFLEKCLHHAAWRLRLLEYAWPLVERELDCPARIPWWRRPALWRRGFLSEAAVLYPRGDLGPYLSDYARAVKTRLINGAPGVLLDDKLLFARILGEHARHMPTLYGTLSRGRVVPVEGLGVPQADAALPDLLRAKRALALKPVTGGGGRGVTLLHMDEDGAVAVNGTKMTEPQLARTLEACEGYLVGECIRQHPVIAALYPETINTVRIVTMRDEDGVFIAAAALRIGCARSRPTDNWGRGGLSASVERGSGRLGRAASYAAAQARLQWHASHPESGAPIEGTVIPHWRAITEAILDVARSLPFLPYVGWDVAVTEEGFRILEGNQYGDVHVLQVHEPLLADERVRAFYRRHGVIG